MRNLHLLLGTAIAGIVMAGCSQESTPYRADDSDGIGFSVLARGGDGTRLTGQITDANVTTNGQTMRVWGYKSTAPTDAVFNDVTITYDSTAKNWSYSPIRYWDTQATYHFYALMPGDIPQADVTALPDKYSPAGGFTINHIPACQAINGSEIDYLIATRTVANGADKKPINLKFNHILSQFNVLAKAKVPQSGGYKVTLKYMNISLPTGSASYYQKYAEDVTSYGRGSNDCDTWSSPSATTKRDVLPAGALLLDDNLATNNYIKLPNSYMISPTTVTSAGVRDSISLTMDLTYSVTYDKNGNGTLEAADGDYSESYTFNNMPLQDLHNFTQGYITNLYVLFDMSDDPENPTSNVIKFTVDQVVDWVHSDDNYVDGEGHSFSLTATGAGATATRPALATPAARVKITLDNYGNTLTSTESGTPLTYTFAGTGLLFYNDATGGTPLTGAQTLSFTGHKAVVYVELPVSSSAEELTYLVTVTTNQGDKRTLTLYQEPVLPSIDESSWSGATVSGLTGAIAKEGGPVHFTLTGISAAGARVSLTTNNDYVEITLSDGTLHATTLLDGVANGSTVSFIAPANYTAANRVYTLKIASKATPYKVTTYTLTQPF